MPKFTETVEAAVAMERMVPRLCTFSVRWYFDCMVMAELVFFRL
jgi:hypothetical protein